MKPATIILCAALGMAGVSIAMGMLYKDWRSFAIAKLKLEAASGQKANGDDALVAVEDPQAFRTALLAGTAGVALLGAAFAGTVLRLRWMNQLTSSAPPGT